MSVPDRDPRARVPLDRYPPHLWAAVALVLLTVVYAVLQVGFVRPYLWPAGDGALVAGEAADRVPFVARPPDPAHFHDVPGLVGAVVPGSPADRAGLHAGDRVLREQSGGRSATFGAAAASDEARLDVWRASYWTGVSGPVALDVASPDGALRRVVVDRPSAWRTAAPGWRTRHAGMILQIVVFTAGAIALLWLRSTDLTAILSVLALALSGVAGGGPLVGAEGALPLPLDRVLTVFTWLAGPLAFPIIALAILYFPTRSPLLQRRPWLALVPFLASAPMLVLGGATALYLAGLSAARPLALWDTWHPAAYYGSFAAALAINVLAVAEGVYRYRFNHDANERRRIRMAVYTAVPGVLAYAIKEGGPIAAGLAGAAAPVYPPALAALLQGLVLLPAFGLTYVVGVERVLGPRMVLRRSIQYALASRTLTVLAILPAGALALSLIRDSDRTLAQIVTSGSTVYLLLLGATIVAWRYRDRARVWLDERFFRSEYDARQILLSLATRVRFETDPADLAVLVVQQLDQALHPEFACILVSGVDPGVLTPVSVLHGAADPLPIDAGLATMLRWSDDPLEIFLHDPRSPARRLPEPELAWLERTRATLLVPILGEARALVAVIVLGAKRSEEAYTAEDRQLLASISAQMGLGFDVVRLRRRTDAGTGTPTTIVMPPSAPPMTECPRCGRCEEAGTAVCPADGAAMKPAGTVPRVLDNKYRLEQLLGRGGMGAVYRARDMRLDRLVAVKVVRAELLGDPEARRRFRREAQIVARLQHPGIVSIFDFGTLPDGGAYLVMELVRGEDLRRVLQREGRLDPERVSRILAAVCFAIEAAHRDGVLHRDLKPENILLPGGDVEAKVLDFGVAKLIGDRGEGAAEEGATALTMVGSLVGTPAYMAPEQLRGEAPDARTDVFALGVIGYEMLNGDLPFGRASLAQVVLAQARGLPASEAASTSPVERAIRQALAMDRDDRPASAQTFAALLLAQ
ncbi:MAG TPA: protein kinase [Vicinamibacterales bacterium]|nr:protein kinase [Vicinamibacterales bacterium]